MTALSMLVVTLAAILLPLAIITRRQRNSRQGKIQRAWHHALDRQQRKTESLDRIALKIQQSRAVEDRVLGTVDTLKQDIARLSADAPDQETLQQIERLTENAITQLSDLLDQQIDSDGKPRLSELAEELASRHADDTTALVRLQDAMGDGKPASQQDTAKPEPAAPTATEAAGSDTLSAEESSEPDRPFVPPAADSEKEQPRVH